MQGSVKKRWEPNNLTIAVLLVCLTTILLTATAPAIGLTWDEPAYITAAESYSGWFGLLIRNPVLAFSHASLDSFWYPNHEHPPVDKIWSGIVWSAARIAFDDLTAHRLGNILLVAFLVALIYLIVADKYGKTSGLFAAGAIMSMPRFFFHAHLAALDVPVAVGIFAVTFLFWKTVDRKGWWWGLILGVAFGVAEAIKLNATFLPAALVIWFLALRRRWYLLLRFVIMGLTACLTFVLVWPWIYYQTWSRIMAYAHFHLDHFKIGQWYFGHYYLPPPWHFSFVMVLVVVPLTLLIAAFVGMSRAGSGKKDNGLVWLLIISAIVPLLPFVTGISLAYDDDRLLMPAFPFLAALAGVGFGAAVAVLRRLSDRLGRPGITIPAGLVLAGVLFLPQAINTAKLFPHLLSYYSEAIGGLSGADKLGLETTYWCESYAAALPYINAHASPGDRVWVEPYSYGVLIYYQIHGQLRKDVRITNIAYEPTVFGPGSPQPVISEYYLADWILFQNRQTQFEDSAGSMQELPEYLKRLPPPVFAIGYQGVPIMELFHQ